MRVISASCPGRSVRPKKKASQPSITGATACQRMAGSNATGQPPGQPWARALRMWAARLSSDAKMDSFSGLSAISLTP